jgi:FAD/FMN-containing dehydrogenase
MATMTKSSRRGFLKGLAALSLTAPGCVRIPQPARRIRVNDVQSRLNATYVERISRVRSLAELQATIKEAAETGKRMSICGGRHAMGAQQFLSDGLLLDTTSLSRVLAFDSNQGTIEVEAGIQWPALLKHLLSKQRKPRANVDLCAEADWGKPILPGRRIGVEHS